MLSDEQFSSCIEALVRLGAVERADRGGRGGLLRLNLPTEGVLGRIFGGEFGEPPSGPGLVPWFSCVVLEILLDGKGVVVTKEEFTGIAAVLAAFMTKTDMARTMRLVGDRPVIRRRSAKRLR
jgi:hypothetical protein